MIMLRQSQSPTPAGLDKLHGCNTHPRRPSLPRLATEPDPRAFRRPSQSHTPTRPVQYPLPLSRGHAYGSHGSASERGREHKAPENMLRRKTPSGILHGAYDGTSVVDDTEKPHASKYILVPGNAQTNLPYSNSLSVSLPLRSAHSQMGEQRNRQDASFDWDKTPKPDAPSRSSLLSFDAAGAKRSTGLLAGPGEHAAWSRNPHQPDSGGYGQAGLVAGTQRANTFPLATPIQTPSIGHAQSVPGQDWDHKEYFRTGSGRPAEVRTGVPYGTPQIDSVLNQVTFMHPRPQNPMFVSQYYGVMEPSVPSFGPTVSNDYGPIGPYRHDGTYIPYQPAAMRDPRYQIHPHPHWDSPQHNPWSFYDSPMPAGFQNNHYPLPIPMPPGTYISSGRPGPVFGQQYPGPQLSHPSLPQSYTDLPHINVNRPCAPPSVDQAPTITNPAYASTALSDFSPQSTSVRTRERVFAWAHVVYIDLLKFLQSTRKPNSNSRHPNGMHTGRPHIYPKPPKQPSSILTTIPDPNSAGQSAEWQGSSGSSTQYGLSRHDPARHADSPHDRHGPTMGFPSSAGISRDGGSGQSWPSLAQQQYGIQPMPGPQPPRPLRRVSGTSVAGYNQVFRTENPNITAAAALDAITQHCESSQWQWIDGILLGGCLAYALGDYQKARQWYEHILNLDAAHVEATSNLAATLLALHQKQDAETYWRRAVRLRPSYFEAVEHLVGLLCGDNRGSEAVKIIEEVEGSLSLRKKGDNLRNADMLSESSSSTVSQSPNVSETSDKPFFEYHNDSDRITGLDDLPGSDQPGFGSSGYAIPGSENGRILALVHAKGNMLYALGDNIGAAKAFENAVLIGVGRRVQGIGGLIQHILSVVGYDASERSPGGRLVPPSTDPILLHPTPALKTKQLCFPPRGDLPGLKYVASEGMARRAAETTTSNSLLSLAKIFQDGMATNSPKASAYQTSYSVREILALYYLSLSLQPSPSTANNVGILLASVQQSAPSKVPYPPEPLPSPSIPGLVAGSGVALALAYYNYGLMLDQRHAHLYTNLGSLLKDIGQLDAAIQMYEKAVSCDGNFDIALANLANAVKDKGRVGDAIMYYKRAVQVNPEFAEAVCGQSNALNSVCDWRERGGIAADGAARDPWHVDENGMLLDAKSNPSAKSFGWMSRVVALVQKQLQSGEYWGRESLTDQFVDYITQSIVRNEGWDQNAQERSRRMVQCLTEWQGRKREGARLVRLVERVIKRWTWLWYQDKRAGKERPENFYRRPQLPASLTVPAAPTVLPFHTFTCPMSAAQIRMISQRNGLRISCSTLKASWLPPHVYPPPPPPRPHLNVGYVSSDFNNHPLAHLMQSVFGLHDPKRVKAICYATTPSDGSAHRQQIEREAPVIYDSSGWSTERLVNQIVKDEIHILVNLNGYTRGARNEVFAARPAPIQMSFMGFAGTLGAEWCDYLLADTTAVPPTTLREWRRNVDVEDLLEDEKGEKEDWIYGENIIFCRDTFFCCDHRQSAPDAMGRQLNWEEEQERRWKMRKEIFPNLSDRAIILGNFNQLYKIEPTTFRTWLRILEKLPDAILWLLRFPDLGETNLKETALKWAGAEVASRVIFTNVAEKHQHIARARVCDLFLDTPECNAHTTAADVLWSGTPLLTLPRYEYKMCSRMAASILKGALPKNLDGKQAAKDLIARNEEDYEEKAVRLGKTCRYQDGRLAGRLSDLRKILYEARWSSALFDTKRWVKDLEEAYEISWRKWENAEGGDIYLEPQRDF